MVYQSMTLILCNSILFTFLYNSDDIQNGQFNILPELQVLSHLPICIINNLKGNIE